MKLSDLFTAHSIALHREEISSNRIPYLGEQFFPAEKKLGIDLEWIRAYKGLGVALAPAAFDALATIRPREGVSVTQTKMPFFRESMKVDEKDMIEIMRVEDSGDPFAQEVLRHVYDDANTLIDGAEIVAEIMRMSLLSAQGGVPGISFTGKDNVVYNYNYDPTGSWATDHYMPIVSAADKWNASTAKALDDINTGKKFLQGKGYAPTQMIMNSTTWGYLLNNQQIKDAIVSLSGTAVTYVNDTIVSDIVKAATKLDTLVYDKQYKNYAGTATKFYPDGYVTIIGEPNLGRTFYGTTPEERTLIGNPSVNVSMVEPGIAVTVKEDYGPPVLASTTVSQIVLPSYEGMDGVYVMKVY